MFKFWRGLICLLVMVFVFGFSLVASAQQSNQQSSTNYQINEYSFGSGGDPEVTSTSYKANTQAGTLGVGRVSSNSYSAEAGFVTPREEYLEMVVNAATIDLGTLAANATATGTATFYVRAYTSSGYIVTTVSPPPTNGSVQLAPMTVAAASSQGTEQFGINLVANTSPTTFGSDPVQSPDNTFAFGQAATGYATSNQFKYNQGDTIANSTKGIGQTDYTISYIANMSPISAGGTYTVEHILVVVATY